MVSSRPVRAYLSLGSNLGGRVGYLRSALRQLTEGGVSIQRVSSIYETEPIGYTDQPAFLNIAVQVGVRLEPEDLLDRTCRIEQRLGRRREVAWGPRTLDIDILLYGRRIIQTPALIIPHPRMTERRFVLVPLAEIAPSAVHPLFHRTIRTLLRACKDRARVEKYCQV